MDPVVREENADKALAMIRELAATAAHKARRKHRIFHGPDELPSACPENA